MATLSDQEPVDEHLIQYLYAHTAFMEAQIQILTRSRSQLDTAISIELSQLREEIH
jgi:hypothetical protein